MAKFFLKKEIDTTDLIKSIITIVGAIIAFYFITTTQLDNEAARLKNESVQLKMKLVEIIPKLHPSIQTEYENKIIEEKSEVRIRMKLKILSPFHLYYHPPTISIAKFDGSDTLNQNQVQFENLDSYKGIFPSGTEYNMEYSCIILDTLINLKNYEISLSYQIATEAKIKNMYKNLFIDSDSSYVSVINKISYKTQKYKERIHSYNDRFEHIFD